MKAVLLGATGLVGGALLRQLAEDDRYEEVLTLGRREPSFSHKKVSHEVIDFESPRGWSKLVKGQVLFSALGTTIKTARTKQAQYRVDHDYQLFALQAAADNLMPVACLVSSTGASTRSFAFYSRMKGELEEAAKELGIQRLAILRPGILDGERAEHRPGERAALGVLRKLPRWGLPASARPVPAALVAAAARFLASGPPGVQIAEAAEIFEMGAPDALAGKPL